MSVIHAPRKNDLDVRQAGFLVLVGIVFISFFLRLWYLQLVVSDVLAEKARSMRTVAVKRIAPRGLIYDRNGVEIAGVQPNWVITAVPFEAKKNPWVITKIAQMVEVPEEKLWEKIKANEWRPHFPIGIHVGVTIDVATKIAESGDFLPGIDVETQPLRKYADTVSYSHILGYVWTPNAEDVERHKIQNLDIPDYVGKNGLEREYERLLQGTRGLDRFEVDNKRRPKRVVQRNSPQPGSRLFLSLDADLQQYASAALKGYRGAVVVVQPSTGEVLAMASSPSFDANVFLGGISKADYEKLQSDPGIPELNRAVSARYAPGSTFKIVTAIASQLAGKFSPYRTAYCPGYYKVGNKKTKCLGVHGAISFHSAFARSCNTYFATIGYEAGIEKLREAAEICGLGQQAGIDLPSESSGTFPFLDWLERRELKWYPGDVVNTTIGQGYVAATPLQMADIAAFVANRGTMYQPRLLRAIQSPADEKGVLVDSKAVHSLNLPDSFWDTLQSAMVEVIRSGTATKAQIPGLEWGGKTGSSEHKTGSRTHAWFVGIAPMKQPKLAIAVVLENIGHGGDFSAPIAKSIVGHYFARLANAASASSKAAEADLSGSSRAESPPERNSDSIRRPDSSAR